MPKRCFAGLFLVALAALPARAADPKPDAPALAVRVHSIEGVLADVKYLAGLAGQDEQVKQFEGMLKSMIGENGLEGFDTKRPLGLYGSVGKNVEDSTVVVLLPVADEKAVLALLDRLNVKYAKDDDGVYTVQNDDIPAEVGPVCFRFANKYVYVTARNKAAIAKDKLLAPEKVLPANEIGTASVSVRMDQVPDALKDTALTQLELLVANAKEEKPAGETKAQQEFRVRLLDEAFAAISSVVKDGTDVTLRLDIDRKKNNLAVEMTLAGKDKSKLAANIADLGQAKSLFAAVPGANSALTALARWTLPEKLRDALAPVIDEEIAKAIANEKDPAKRAEAEKAYKALAPTFKAGELDAVFDLRGPGANKLYTAVVGLRLKDGLAIEKVVREAAKDLPEKDKAKITIDAEKAGAVNIHRLDVLKEADADTKKLLGDGPVYFAFRDDAVLAAAGDKALEALKEALAAQPKAVQPLQVELSLARLAPLMAKEQPKAPEIAEKVFAKEKDSDKMRLTVEGGKVMKVRLDMKAALVEFFGKLEQERKK